MGDVLVIFLIGIIMKAIIVIAVVAITATFAFGSVSHGTEQVKSRNAKIEQILNAAQ
jgi:Tfp pilus assembly protein FimT